MRTLLICGILIWALSPGPALRGAAAWPHYGTRGMVVAQETLAAQVGAEVLRDGGNAIDAAVATAFALAVTHPAAGNIGGGGFLLYRDAGGKAVIYDFREVAPGRAHPAMFLEGGKYDERRHHWGPIAVAVPGTVAGLHLAWSDHGNLSWKRLLAPAIALAKEGFEVSHELAGSLKSILPEMRAYPPSLAQFSKKGVPYEAGERLRQPDLARTLERIRREGPAGFYQGRTAMLVEKEMAARGGWITREDLSHYRALRREPLRGTYRGYGIISVSPPSSGGVALIEMLNLLEGYDLAGSGSGSAQGIHWMAESMRRAFADRARYLGDPDFNSSMPLSKLISKSSALELRRTIREDRASESTPGRFEWPREGQETTHVSVVDAARQAVALTYTLEQSYGSRIVVPGAGFLLNNEMGDFNGAPGMTTAEGLIGTNPNLAEPGKRMVSSMTPTIIEKDGDLFLVLGSPGGRTIMNSVLLTLLNVVDFRMNIQEAVNAPRFHHQWLPDQIQFERRGISPDTVSALRSRGHRLAESGAQGVVQAILVDRSRGRLEGAADPRSAGSAAVAW